MLVQSARPDAPPRTHSSSIPGSRRLVRVHDNLLLTGITLERTTLSADTAFLPRRGPTLPRRWSIVTVARVRRLSATTAAVVTPVSFLALCGTRRHGSSASGFGDRGGAGTGPISANRQLDFLNHRGGFGRRLVGGVGKRGTTESAERPRPRWWSGFRRCRSPRRSLRDVCFPVLLFNFYES